MSRRLAVIVFLVLAPLVHAQTRGGIDWIFVVDTSASMRGKGGTQDIFDEVKGSLATFVREASDGDSISILTFDRDVESKGLRDLHGDFDRDELKAQIAALEANGNRTHLGLAIREGLRRADALRKRGDPTRSRAVVLFTDGKQDTRGIKDPVSIESNVHKVGDTFVFFVSMGDHEPQLDLFAAATPQSRVLRAPTPALIRGVAQQIRTVVTPPPPPPPPPKFTIKPESFDLGQVKTGESSADLVATIESDKPAHTRLHIDMPAGITTIDPGMLELNASEPVTIKLRFDVAEEVSLGVKQITISARNAKTTVRFEVIAPSLLERLAKYLVALALLIAAAVFLYFRHKKNHELEGALEIVRPRVADDAAFVGLPRLKKSEVALSSIVPLSDGSDARLFVRRRNGEKQVCISAQSGLLRVNDVETPLSELYDADLIEIGEAKLRFNRAGHVRAAESMGEEL